MATKLRACHRFKTTLPMSLDHLPASRQCELAHVARVLCEEFEAAHALGAEAWKKAGRIFKIVLYGSFARGDWVDDPVGGCQFDYDNLIVVNDERLTEFECWSAAEDRLMRDATITKALRRATRSTTTNCVGWPSGSHCSRNLSARCASDAWRGRGECPIGLLPIADFGEAHRFRSVQTPRAEAHEWLELGRKRPVGC